MREKWWFPKTKRTFDWQLAVHLSGDNERFEHELDDDLHLRNVRGEVDDDAQAAAHREEERQSGLERKL